jgi:hypothetical protein
MYVFVLNIVIVALVLGLLFILAVTLHLRSLVNKFRWNSLLPQPDQNIVVEPVVDETSYVDSFGNTIYPGDKVITITNEPDDDDFVMTYLGVTTKHNIPVVMDSERKELLFCLGRVYAHTDHLESLLSTFKPIERYNYMAYQLGAGDSQIREKYGERYKVWGDS